MTTGTPAVVYVRISDDVRGDEAGIERQLADCAQLAAQRGYEVVGEFKDNDVSAYNPRAVREHYTRMMAAIGKGQFSKIIAYQPSRLWRQRRERVDAIEKLAAARVGVVFVKGPELELDTAYGRSMAVMLGEFDTMESEIKSERIQRESLQRAKQGRANGHVAYGWRRVYDQDPDTGLVKGFHDVEDDLEAAIVREAINRVLSRESIHSIVRDFNLRQVPTPAQKRAAVTLRSRRRRVGTPNDKWNPASLRSLILRPANIGLRQHKGKVLGSAAWPAIVEQDKYDAVVALLTAPERRTIKDGKRRHLLTFGIGVCGVCGGELKTGSARRKGRQHTFYTCVNLCVSRAQDPVDALVADVVIERFSRPDAASIFDGDDSAAQAAREKAGGIRARLDIAADQFADGTIDGEQLKRITQKLRPELAAAEEEARRSARQPIPPEANGLFEGKVADIWHAMTVTQKRAVLQALGMKVALLPRVKSGPGFEPETVQITCF